MPVLAERSLRVAISEAEVQEEQAKERDADEPHECDAQTTSADAVKILEVSRCRPSQNEA